MTRPQQNTALSAAIVCGLLSVPLTWMTIRNPELPGGFGGMFPAAFSGMSIDVTGLNGSITVLFKTPIWFVMCVAIAASALQLLSQSGTFAIPRIAQWSIAVLALIWVGVAILTGLASSKATLGIGALLGLASAVIPVVCLFLTRSPKPAKTDPFT